MGETYCGKTCDNCTWKEKLNCPGCKSGPGKALCTDCSIATCCREKGHDACDTCNLNAGCLSLRNRNDKPKQRLEILEAEQERKTEADNRALAIGKWLWILFLLVIPSIVTDIMTVGFFAREVPVVYRIGEVSGIIVSLLYGVVLLKLSSAEEKYKQAGIYYLIVVVESILDLLMWSGSEESVGRLLMTLAITLLSFYATYLEIMAHSSVLIGIDDRLSQDWADIWKFLLGANLGLIGGTVFMLVSIILGTIIVFLSVVFMIIMSVYRIIYLYHTAVVFRDYNV